jgi:hypothetical protein
MTKPPWAKAKDFPDTEPMVRPGEDGAYADTAPQPLASVRPAAPAFPDGLSLELAPVEISLYEVMAEARKNNRVCPQPTRWLEIYRLLEQSAAGAALPAAPLVGSAWASTPPLAKRMCFHEQLEWAAAHDCLNPVYDYLKNLSDPEWYIA